MLLAIDLATVSGWAAGAIGEKSPRHGHHALPALGDDHTQAYFHQHAVWLGQLLIDVKPIEVAIEQPFIMPGRDDMLTVYKLSGLAVVTELVCKDRKIDVHRVPVRTWRNSFLGKERYAVAAPGGRDALKAAAVEVCRLHGWQPRTNDEADALGLWHHWQSKRQFEQRARVLV